MSRRVLIAVAVIVALFAGRVLVSRGIHRGSAAPPDANQTVTPDSAPAVANPGDAAKTGATDAVPTTSSDSASTSAKAESAYGSSAASPASQGDNGVTDVDPHKAFGSKSAPVVMEIFSDYQCPSCRFLFQSTNRQLMENYVTTGKVYVIHRDFPLAMHAYSKVAARYARAAADLGKVEPVEKALYDNQDKWEQTGDVDGTVAGVLSSAEMTKVRALVKGGTLDPLIEKDLQLGQMYRVNQTPTTVFHMKGQTYPYSGSMNWDTLRQFLDQLLSQK